jgi:origin recognition complex subunit 1
VDSDSVVSTSHILSHCVISSATSQRVEAEPGKASSNKNKRSRYVNPEEYERNFYCGYAVNSQRGIFYEFNWEKHRTGALASLSKGSESADPSLSRIWDVLVKDVGIPKKKRLTRIAEDSEENEGSDEEYKQDASVVVEEESVDNEETEALDSEDEIHSAKYRSPSKKRKRGPPPSTPRKNKRAILQPTPQSRKRIAHRTQKHRGPAGRPPPPELVALTARLPGDPWLRAMHILHVAARPEALPCRDEEYDRVMRAVEELLEEGSGGCICEYTSELFLQLLTLKLRHIWCTWHREDRDRTRCCS